MKKLSFLIMLLAIVGMTASSFVRRTCADTFKGRSRLKAKTSIASVTPHAISIPELYNRPLPSDSEMKAPPYSVKRQSDRSEPEKENVTITCWLHTYKYEPDGDYHLIIGSTKNKNTARFFSAEISGLPKRNSENYIYYDQLKKARDQFKALVDNDCQKKYDTTGTPIKIIVTGSLFWDIDHNGGGCCSGTGTYVSESPWEIHPVTNIELVRIE